MQLIPDVSTAYLDPFRADKTLVVNFFIHDPLTGEAYSRDPRNIARKAQEYLKSTGIGDTAYFAPEAEFYIFDNVRFATRENEGFYHVDSIAGAWNSGVEAENRGYKVRYKGGYFPVPPYDHFADIRAEISKELEAAGLVVERQHHEVGTAGQAEINFRFDDTSWGARGEFTAASGYLGQSDLWGVQAMPFYNVTDKLQGVARYTYLQSEHPNGVRLATYESRVVTGRGDQYNEIYLGANYYFYGHRLKLQTGVQFADMDDQANDGGAYSGVSWTTGLRVGW